MSVPFHIDLNGKVAVVTGAGGVLCSGMAEALAQCGAKVALLDLPCLCLSYLATASARPA